MGVSYPREVDTEEKEMAHLTHLYHINGGYNNVMALWKDEGIDSALYNSLPAKVRVDFPFVEGKKLSEKDYRDYKTMHDFGFQKVSQKIFPRLNEIKSKFAKGQGTIKADFNRDVS